MSARPAGPAASLPRLATRERACLCWLRRWAQRRLRIHRRVRKYRPRGDYTPEELAILGALVDLRKLPRDYCTMGHCTNRRDELAQGV